MGAVKHKKPKGSKQKKVFFGKKTRFANLREDITDALHGHSPRKRRMVRGQLLWYTTFTRLLVRALLDDRRQHQRVAVHHHHEREFGEEVVECFREMLPGRCSVQIEFEMIPLEERSRYPFGSILADA
jgi:hypothetical protein